MTDTAIILRRDVIRFFAGCGGAVMAGGTVIANAGVTKRRPAKGVRVEMTDRARLCRWHVGSVFAGTDHTVVTRLTVTGDTGVIKCAAGKGAWRVAIAAITGSCNVVGRFANGVVAIVAGCAIACESGVIEE